MSVNELAEFVHPVTSRWWSGESNAKTIAAALRFMGVESHQEQRDRAIADQKKPFKNYGRTVGAITRRKLFGL